MKYNQAVSLLLAAVCLLPVLSGCATKKREAVEPLQCTRPAALNCLYPVSGTQVAVSWTDYENDCTTVQLVDVNKDTVCREITLEGVWDLKEQAFSDGRFALCRRETNTWKFLSDTLEELNEWDAENSDGFFSYDGSSYYYLCDRMLYRQQIDGGEKVKVKLPLELRLLELTAFDAPRGTLVMQFFLSPYGSECGTAVWDIETGAFTMLQKDRYRAFFREDGICLLSFDNEKGSYSVTYEDGDGSLFADAEAFSDTAGDLYAISGSPYLMGITAGRSTLYAANQQINACPLSGYGIEGEMYSACYLSEESLLVGAVYQDGGFRLYVIDPAQLAFARTAEAASTPSPFTVDDGLAQSFRDAASDVPVAETLQQARQYADMLEEKYSVHILLSSQCKDAAALCDKAITLTDSMSAEEETEGISATLQALDRTLALYPEGFSAQFRNSAGEGGLCFLPVEYVEGADGIVGCAYERFEWQYIALEIHPSYSPDSVICHEMWHATENLIRSRDHRALSMDEWDALNPKGFSYTEDAAKTASGQPWTLYTGSPEDIHFVDSYACVARTEDRARIMEYIMTREDEAKLLIQSPYIRKKLQMMCDAVRSTFDTAGWENVRWEQWLDIPPSNPPND